MQSLKGALSRSVLQLGWSEEAHAALSTAIELYHAMEMTLWLPQAEAALARGERSRGTNTLHRLIACLRRQWRLGPFNHAVMPQVMAVAVVSCPTTATEV